MEAHNERVRSIASQVASFHERKERFRIYHGSTSTTRKVQLSRNSVVDTSGMNHILSIDTEKKTALVEPNVSMAQLVDATLEQGLLPPVVMEFPAITVGGGFAGTAGESSSFRYGLFDKTVERIEIVLADGEVVSASASSQGEREDLFHGAAGSFGTLGVITLLQMRLIEAREFVEVRYRMVKSIEGAVSMVEQCTTDEKIDYVEGIMFGLDRGVILSGRLSDGATGSGLPCSRFTRRRDPWFYIHVESVLKRHRDSAEDYCELIPIRGYLFRYDRGAFWAGKYAFKYFLTPMTALSRWALDGLMHTADMYHALHKSRIADQFIVQDIGFPYARVGDFVEFLHSRFGFYPLWLCPLKMDSPISLQPHNVPALDLHARSQGMMMNVGLWGPGPKRYEKWVQANREIEHKTAELGGLKCFYAQAFYSPDEFWTLYDKKANDSLREKYKATGLPSVQEKINVDFAAREREMQDWNWRQWMLQRFKEQWPVRGVYGVLHLLTSREYLL